MHSPANATGIRLAKMRKSSKLSIEKAHERANNIARELGCDEISLRSMRRFEKLGIKDSYGQTPPTFEQLNILMRTYNGSPGYLILGIPPATYPIELFDRHKASFFSDEMLSLMSDIASWPAERQKLFFQFYKTFLCD